MPVNVAVVIAGIVVVLALIAGVIMPGARRRERARGKGTTGRRRRRP